MFTGLVEEVGTVVERAGPRLVVAASHVLEDTGLGASVAVNGACLTVVEVGGGRLRFDVGPETLARTALGDLAAGDRVNLERPMRLGGMVGGHLVQGHVDGVGTVAALTRQADTARLTIEWPCSELAPLLIPQGSVAVDGVTGRLAFSSSASNSCAETLPARIGMASGISGRNSAKWLASGTDALQFKPAPAARARRYAR